MSVVLQLSVALSVVQQRSSLPTTHALPVAIYSHSALPAPTLLPALPAKSGTRFRDDATTFKAALPSPQPSSTDKPRIIAVSATKTPSILMLKLKVANAERGDSFRASALQWKGAYR